MKNILIPTDFSENSWNAIKYALNLYKKNSCNIFLLNVVRVSPGLASDDYSVFTTQTVEQTMVKEAKAKLQQLEKKIQQLPFNTRHNFVSNAVYGLFIEEIRSHVSENNIDLIVMGTKGASGIKQLVIGSNTGDVITKVKCPVLVIPEEAEYVKPREIAIPTDYNIFYSINVLDTILEMAHLYNSSIRIVYVSKDNEELNEGQLKNKTLLESYFEGTDHSFHTLTNNKLEAAIQCFVESRDIDMIAMVAKHLNFFQQILFRPTVEEISYHTKVPFFVLHE
ncbi:universal stress protein [Abyssalbus ytuae]|uniref:Universal stress protein n=1 Tax=Abyssalbus ytuae TaxID=2926907 RepID=A0A9E6ZSA5_9FLAO|nr:universal stress protein [Abyssalbus ytuae]UOB17928.1 universal stress protein [Abyssalbus ytuae]